MTSKGLGDSSDKCAGKCPLVSMGAEDIACADLGARTLIGAGGNLEGVVVVF
jgi:hypothetical protein